MMFLALLCSLPVALGTGSSAGTEALHLPDSVLVKFHDRTPVRLRDGQLVALDARGRITFSPASGTLAGAVVERLFQRSEASLETERSRLLRALPGDVRPPADLNNYYRVRTRGAADSARLVRTLQGLPSVEVAYPEPAPASLVTLGGQDVAPPTPTFTDRQGYLGPAPLGVGHEAVLDIVGATAPDLRVYQVEFEWFFGHEDACRLIRDNVIGLQPPDDATYFADHATAVAGILTADRNGFGVDGMASDAGFRVVSAARHFPPAVAISLITADARPGDVFVTSMGWFLPTGVLAPLDFHPAEFDAIYTATLSGVVYCFGAGNRAAPAPSGDLCDPDLYGDRYLPTSRQSGGIIVGGGLSTAVTPWPDSNYGQRIDCHAWSENIATTGFGGSLFAVPGNLQDYTEVFFGTSGSGPIVAGVAAALSNIVREQNGVLLTPSEVRQVLRTRGTPQAAGVPIGPRPDLEDYLAAFGLPDGLRLHPRPATHDFLLEVTGAPGNRVLLLSAPARGRTDVGLNRDVLVDLSGATRRWVRLGPDGTYRMEIRLPAQLAPSPRLYFQALELRRAEGKLHLTNSVELRADRLR